MKLSLLERDGLERERLTFAREPVTELDGDRVRAEDLSAYYPTATQTSPNGAGRPAAPAAASAPAARGVAAIGGSPAISVLAIVAISLFLLHRAG